jgi:purine nucleoside phosphorylase
MFHPHSQDLIGMTGANEAELMNELRIPFAMFGLIDNMANGLGEKLTVRYMYCSSLIPAALIC